MRDRSVSPEHNPHEFCRRALARAYETAADRTRIHQILRQLPNGQHEVLTLVRVDAFENGLRIVVQ